MSPTATSTPTWSPLLEGEDRERALAAVTAVAEAIGDAPLAGAASGPTLATGEAGVALLFDALERAGFGAGYGEIAVLRIERAMELLAASPLEPGLFSGFTGVGWVAEVLQRGLADDGAAEAGDLEDDEQDLNVSVDEALAHHLAKTPWTYHFDLTTGLAGYGVYALERLPHPAAVAALEWIVEHLAEIAAPRPGGLCWHTPYEMQPEPNRKWFPKGLDNLGVAHGTPGVIALLARIVAAGVAVERAGGLLRSAVAWLLAQKLPLGERSIFPYSVGEEVKIRPTRAAWCFGDPGIAAALLAAGRAAGEPEWEREGLAAARAVAVRQAERCGVNDACLCHGAAGLGHVLNRLYQATGDPDLREGARAWLRRALDFRQPGRGIGGFLALIPLDGDFENLDWQEDPSFLNGSTGMALTLLAAISEEEPAWDRALLLSPLAGRTSTA